MELLRTGSKRSYSCDVLKMEYIRLGTGNIAIEMKEMKINKSSYLRNIHNMTQQYHLIFLSIKELTPEATNGQSNLT